MSKRNYDEFSLVADFQQITGLEDADLIQNLLEASNYSLDNALDMYYSTLKQESNFDIPEHNHQESEPVVRQPDKTKRQRLIHENHEQSNRHFLLTLSHFICLRSSDLAPVVKKNTAASFSSSSRSQNALNMLYQIPVGMMTSGSFDKVISLSEIFCRKFILSFRCLMQRRKAASGYS
jgi:hypothetical protein